MKSLAPTKTLNSENLCQRSAQRSSPKLRRVVLMLGTLLLAFGPHHLRAQVGDDNPTGHSGFFNGSLESVGVDPRTANATRSITDISVAGAVGKYPLALVRTANSRTPSTTNVFSKSGGWNHNYNWILEDSSLGPIHPKRYTVEFPDGRVETFRVVAWNPAENYFRVRPGNSDDPSPGSAGVRERFVPLDTNPTSPTYMYAYLILPDGGKIEFRAHQRVSGSQYSYKYHVTAIIDPYGLKTIIASEVVGPQNNRRRRITKVTEPAGRYLQFSYPPNSNGPRISQVQEFINGAGGRKVQYYYACCNNWALERVVYYNNPNNWTAKYQYTNSNIGDPDNNPPLLKTCDDPMYAGPMKKIYYQYKTGTNSDQTDAVYGQVWKVSHWDGTPGHENNGPVVSTLTVGFPDGNPVNRTETRGDGATRTFIYNGAGRGYLGWASDFTGHQSNLGYDGKKYVDSVTNFNRVTTDYTNDPITGKVTQIKYPFTQDDTPGQNSQPTVNYTYTNSYYLHTIQGEGGPIQTTTIARDGNNRVTQITYPDGGDETFTDYDAFNQARNHRMTTGGTETFTFDSTNGRKLTYRNPDDPSGNPTVQYFYDSLGRVNGVYDALNHPTNYEYNDRGQLTVTTLPPDDNNQRKKITNFYNSDGTLQYRTDELGAYANDPAHTTTHAYDDYRRLKSVTGPQRGQGNNNRYTTYFFYGANPSDDFINDYKHTDSNVTYVKLPSGKKIKTVYDDNRRKWKVTVGYQSGDDATTTYLYDGMGNVTWLTNPRGVNTSFYYDDRNRPKEFHDVYGNITRFKYDTAGRKYRIERPNGQVITYEAYDAMNHLTQQRVKQTPNPDAVTKYTYHPGSGLLYTMQDPRSVALGRDPDPWVGYVYTYIYDEMGRKSVVGYPPDSGDPRTFEAYTYDTAGRLDTYQNRNGKIQTFHYDTLNRVKWFEWSGGAAPRVDFGYDAASRLTSINNASANITRQYYNDNLLYKETEQILLTGGRSKAVTYTYDADGNRGSIQYPDGGYNFNYTYNGRNQLKTVGGSWATYTYDENGYKGDVTTRTLNNGTHTNYAYDALDRVTWVTHSFGRYFNYGYDNASGNRKWTKREDGYGDAFGYDLNDQVKAVFLDVQSPEGVSTDDQTIFYDGSGNRTRFEPYDLTELYTINDLSQYPLRNVSERDAPDRPTPTPRPRPSPTPRPTPPGQQAAAYDYAGNMVNGFDGSTYEYDAQNRLLSATKDGATISFKYDGLNRQVSRTFNSTTTFNVWDGWDLIEEYQPANNGAMTAMYLYGAGDVIVSAAAGQLNYYYQDGSGSTSHVTDENGNLKEWYLYDLQGAPSFFDANGNQLLSTNRFVRHLFTGQQWYSGIGLYDLRNRFYSPDIGRFLQPDPSGFEGDATNLYRYAGNNPVTSSDPMGLDAVHHSGGYYTYVANWRYVAGLAASGSYVALNAGGTWVQCAAAARYLGGGYWGGVYYNMPKVGRWYQGASISRYTTPGTVVVKNWAADGSYPNMTIDEAKRLGVPINHTAVFGYIDSQGKGHLYAQNPGPMHEEIVPAKEVSQWSEVRVDDSNGPYEGTPSDRSVAGGNGASSHRGINTRVPSIIGGIFYPYGFGNMSPNLNFAGGRAGTMQGAFTWGQIGDGSTPNFAPVYGGDIVAGGEPFDGCFAAGTPILMADRTEKPIESIQVGEEVLAWNEETKTAFPSKVVSALHHDEKMQTLFDIELDDGRRFTANNNHPMYVVEDGDFKFTDELATRFAKGQPITFQDFDNQPVKVARLHMRNEICKVYNLHVQGQAMNGHTYYASGILVHNFGAGFRRK